MTILGKNRSTLAKILRATTFLVAIIGTAPRADAQTAAPQLDVAPVFAVTSTAITNTALSKYEKLALAFEEAKGRVPTLAPFEGHQTINVVTVPADGIYWTSSRPAPLFKIEISKSNFGPQIGPRAEFYFSQLLYSETKYGLFGGTRAVWKNTCKMPCKVELERESGLKIVGANHDVGEWETGSAIYGAIGEYRQINAKEIVFKKDAPSAPSAWENAADPKFQPVYTYFWVDQ